MLEVLEELRIPVDFIAGTSIGAAIGGLYASGMSVPDLKALLESLDWQDLLSDQPPRRYQPFRLKSTDRRIPARLEVGFNGGKFRLPTGIVTGQNVELTLRSVTLPVAHIRSFERLPTPFVAVATDLVTGEMVVLDRGDLSRAMRASMSIPGAFSPVEVDGLVLVDGGLVRNLPVDVVRAMGADVVIAVDLTPPLYDAEELESAIEVSMQTFRISTLQNTVPQREALVAGRDVLLRPDVADVPITDFRSLTGAFAAGAEVTRAAGEDLVQWSLSHEDYTAFRESRPRIEDRPETIDFVRIEGASRTSPGHLRGRLGIVAGDALMAETLERGLNRVFAMDLYQGVDYSLVREDGADGLLVKVTEKPWGPGLMRFGLAFGNDLERGRSGLTVLATHRQTQLNGRGGELLAELRLGEAQGAEIELFQPLDVGGRFFIAPRLDYQEEYLEVAVVGAGEVSRGIRETNAAIVLGAQWGDWGELRVELVRGHRERASLTRRRRRRTAGENGIRRCTRRRRETSRAEGRRRDDGACVLLHGDETEAWGDAGYQGVDKRPENRGCDVAWQVAMKPGKRRLLDRDGAEAEAEKRKASVRAKVEHPFLYVKRRFGYEASTPTSGRFSPGSRSICLMMRRFRRAGRGVT